MTAIETTLAQRLAGVVATVRSELDVSRQVFRDGPGYVVRDPISFKTLRLDPEDYQVLVALREDRSLSETFDALVADGVLSQDDEEDFYAFVLNLHRQGMLSLPVNDADSLYARFERRRRLEARAKILGFLFLRVPLVNPDLFLDRTVRFVAPLFTRNALIAWALLMLAALGVAIARWSDLTAPVLAMISGDRLILLWFTLIALKVIHEFGHAYACKIFNGKVPEMGAFFILFTPCAYVDATDSWSFPSRTRRIIVALAGMYFESIVGAIALFVWALTSDSTLNTIAYQTVMLSTIVTIGFNANPLMRYDGYYILSDLVNIPNLRSRATEAFRNFLKRIALGIRVDDGLSRRHRHILIALGLAFSLYKTTLVFTMSAVIATKIYFLGIAIALFYALSTILKQGIKLVQYLLFADETRPVRLRAIAVLVLLFVIVPACLTLIPIRPTTTVRGVIGHTRETTIRAQVPGFLTVPPPPVGAEVPGGAPLASLENPELEAQVAIAAASAQISAATLRRHAILDDLLPPPWLTQSAVDLARLADAEHQAALLHPKAPYRARIIERHTPYEGTYLNPGDAIATIAAGGLCADLLIREDELELYPLAVGDELTCRPVADPTRTIRARVDFVESAATRDEVDPFMTSMGAGAITINPHSGRAAHPLVRVRLTLLDADGLDQHAQIRVRLAGHPRPMVAVVTRRLARFLNSLRREQS